MKGEIMKLRSWPQAMGSASSPENRPKIRSSSRGHACTRSHSDRFHTPTNFCSLHALPPKPFPPLGAKLARPLCSLSCPCAAMASVMPAAATATTVPAGTARGNISSAAAVVCYSPMMVTAYGIWQGGNPLEFSLPLFILQTAIIVVTTRILVLLLKPFRQPRVIAEILVRKLSLYIYALCLGHACSICFISE
jgi:hypothetical protein